MRISSVAEEALLRNSQVELKTRQFASTATSSIRLGCILLLSILAEPSLLASGVVAPDPRPTVVREGRVVDAEGTSVEGARVWHDVMRLEPYGIESPKHAATSDANGRFVLEHPQYPATTETIFFHVFKEGYPVTNLAGPPESTRQLLIELPEPLHITGVVRDHEGKPLQGVTVLALPISAISQGLWPAAALSQDRPDLVYTSADGRFSVPVSAGIWNVGFKREGYLLATLEGLRIGTEDVVTDLTMHRGLDLRGRVVAANGEGVAGIEVMLQDRVHHLHAETDEAGVFQLSGVSPGHRTLQYGVGRLRLTETVEVTEGTEVELELPPFGEVRGRVYDAATGSPIEGASLMLRSILNPDQQFAENASTDETGAFIFSRVPAGEILILASASNHVPHSTEARNLRGDATLAYDINLARGTSLRGRVVDDRGDPLEATVRAKKDRHRLGATHLYETLTKTDADGRYLVENIGPGSREVTVAASCCLQKKIIIEFGDSPAQLDVALERGLTIEGRITDNSGRAIQDATIRAIPESGDRPSALFARSDEQGRYRVQGLPEGNYTVLVDYGDYISHRVLAAAGQREVDVVLEIGATIAGTIRGVRGGEYVTALRGEGPRTEAIGRDSIDRHGRFRLTGLGGGVVDIHLGVPGKSSLHIGTVDVQPPQTHILNVDLDAVETSTGRVFLNGELLKQVRIRWLDRNGSRGEIDSDSSGLLVASGLSNDRHLAFISSGKALGSVRTVLEVENHEFEIRLDGSPMRLEVVDLFGDPITGAEIRFVDVKGPPTQVLPFRTSKGIAQIPFVPHGPFRVRVSFDGHITEAAGHHTGGTVTTPTFRLQLSSEPE